jgi:K+ transporter
VPFTSPTLFLAVMALVMGFGSSSNLAAACGIAVTGAMMIDTLLVAFVMLRVWRWSPRVALPLVRVLIVTVVPEEIPFVPVACTGSGAGTERSRPDRRPELRC